MKFANAILFFITAASLASATRIGSLSSGSLSSPSFSFCKLPANKGIEDETFLSTTRFGISEEEFEEILKAADSFRIGSNPKDGFFLNRSCKLVPNEGDICVPDKTSCQYRKMTLENRGPTMMTNEEAFLPGGIGDVPGGKFGNDCEYIPFAFECKRMSARTFRRMPPLPGREPEYYPGGPGSDPDTVLDESCRPMPLNGTTGTCVSNGLELIFSKKRFWKNNIPPLFRGFPVHYPGDTVEEGMVLDDDCNLTCPKSSGEGGRPTSYGDPHFKTWSGECYDFHGGCDLVLLQNHRFADGLGMNIHIRTKTRSSWSFIDSAVVQVGENMLGMMGGTEGGSYWINQGEKIRLQTGDAALGDFPIHFMRVNDHQSRARVDIGNGDAISIETFKDFVRVNIGNNSNKAFDGSVGLLGRYPDGVKLGRDGATVYEDPNEFGQEWMVKQSDAILFHDVEAGQLPLRCAMPEMDSRETRRRLGESAITEEEAAMACAGVLERDRDSCIFDVLATNDKDMAGSY